MRKPCLHHHYAVLRSSKSQYRTFLWMGFGALVCRSTGAGLVPKRPDGLLRGDHDAVVRVKPLTFAGRNNLR